MRKQTVYIVKKWASEVLTAKGRHLGLIQQEYYSPQDMWAVTFGDAEHALVEGKFVYLDIASAHSALRNELQTKVDWYTKQRDAYTQKLDEARMDLATL